MIGPGACRVYEYGSCDCEPVNAGLPEAARAGERRDARALDHLAATGFEEAGAALQKRININVFCAPFYHGGGDIFAPEYGHEGASLIGCERLKACCAFKVIGQHVELVLLYHEHFTAG